MGLVVDIRGSYDIAFYVLAGFSAVSAVLFLLAKRPADPAPAVAKPLVT
jgi:hypothetical protein